MSLSLLIIGVLTLIPQELKFVDAVNKHITNNSKLSEVALACVVDLCRCAAYIYPEGDVPLRIVAADVAHDIKVRNTLAICIR